MTSIVPLLLWCVLQVTVISAIGVFLSICFAPRYPRLAATSAIVATVMTLVSTLAILFPVPHWSVQAELVGNEESCIVVDQHKTVRAQEHASGLPSESLFDLGKIAFYLASTIGEQQVSASRRPILVCLLSLAATSVLIVGLARLGVSIHHLAKLRRQSEPIRDASLHALLLSLQDEVSLTTPLQLRSSSQIQSAAVLGSFTPTIVLTASWASWSPMQLRAVLAHELAHISYRDSFWRMMSAISTAIHFYNPFVHWLWQRLADAQELAADQYAAAVCDGRISYSKVLSQLAIMQDEASRLRAAPLLLPSMSNDLIRRIKMIRSKECLETGRTHLAARAAIVVLVGFIGLGITAMRGLADETELDSISQRMTPVKEQSPAAMLHRREPSVLLVDKANDKGVFHLKFAELIRCKSLQHYLPTLKQAADVAWQDLFLSSQSPDIDLTSIESISGQIVVKVKEVKPCEEGNNDPHSHQLMLGAAYAVVRFKDHIPHWEDWIRTHIPGAEETESSYGTTFRLPVIHAIGPEPAMVTVRDSKTLLILVDQNYHSSISDMQLQQAGGQWDKAWNSVDHGLLTILVSTNGIDLSGNENMSPKEQAVTELVESCYQIGSSIDLNEEYWQAGVKVQFYCNDRESAERLSTALGKLADQQLDVAKDELQELEEGNTDSSTSDCMALQNQSIEQAVNTLTALQQSTIVDNDGMSVVEVSIPLTLADLFSQLSN